MYETNKSCDDYDYRNPYASFDPDAILDRCETDEADEANEEGQPRETAPDAKRKRPKALCFLLDQMQLAERILPPEELGMLYAVLRAYGAGEGCTLPKDASQALCAVFEMMAVSQDQALQRYDETCRRNSAIAKKRWEKEREKAQQPSSGSTKSKTLGIHYL